MTFRLLLCTSIFPLLWSCNSPSKEGSEAEQILKSTETGDFRSVNIGDPYREVISREGEHMVYSMPDELMYRIPLDQKDSTYFEVTYNFNEAGLYNIVLEIFPRDEVQLSQMNQDFVAFYTSRYGPLTMKGGRSEWRVMTAEGRFVRVIIADSLRKNNKPCLKIHFDEYN